MDWTTIFVTLAKLGVELAPILQKLLAGKPDHELTDAEMKARRAIITGLNAAIQAAG